MTLESIKKQVYKRFPGAVSRITAFGEWYIEWNDLNLNDMFLDKEVSTELDAWICAMNNAKLQQCMNRTHPLKQMISQQRKMQNKERIANRIHGR